MKPPRPYVVWIALAVLVLVSLSRAMTNGAVGGSGFESGRQIGYLFGTIVIPIVLGLLYSRWYHRRQPKP